IKLAKFTQAASRTRYRPRIQAGTSEVIHGSQAQLEMPRERLTAKSNISISARRVAGSRKTSSGTSAIAKMNRTRAPQPAYTNRLYTTRATYGAAGSRNI